MVCLLVSVLTANNVHASELIINLVGQNKPGTLFLAIYADADTYRQGIKDGGDATVDVDTYYKSKTFLAVKDVHNVIVDIPDGIYALAFFIDTDGNGKLNKNFLGIPKEQFGFSNNAMGALSAPSFEQASFTVFDQTVQNIKIK